MAFTCLIHVAMGYGLGIKILLTCVCVCVSVLRTLRKKSLEGMKRSRQQEGAASDDSEVEDPGMQEDQPEAEESEDEAEYYRQAVGKEPDEGIITYTYLLLHSQAHSICLFTKCLFKISQRFKYKNLLNVLSLYLFRYVPHCQEETWPE